MWDSDFPPRTPHADYDELWAYSWGDLQKYGPVSRHQRRIVANMLDPIQHDFDSLMDVGCGEGTTLSFLAQRYKGKQFSGVDISSKAVAMAKASCPSASFHVGPLAEVVRDEKVDVVISIDVLEHVENDAELLRQMAATANKYVLCSTIQGVMRPSEMKIGHVRNYAYGELSAKMEAAGLEPIQFVQWGFPLYSPIFRDLLEATHSEHLSFGSYGPLRKLLCHTIYGLFFLNSSRRGDMIFTLARVRSRPCCGEDP